MEVNFNIILPSTQMSSKQPRHFWSSTETVLCLHLSCSSCVLQCFANHISYIALKLLRLWYPTIYPNFFPVFFSPPRNIRELFYNFRYYRSVRRLGSELFIVHQIEYLKFRRRYF